MVLLNVSEIQGRQYELIKLVKGSAVRGTMTDIFSKWQVFTGNEMKGYTAILEKLRDTATQRMAEEAENIQAHAVIGVVYSATQIMPGTVEIIVYGTAVRFID